MRRTRTTECSPRRPGPDRINKSCPHPRHCAQTPPGLRSPAAGAPQPRPASAGQRSGIGQRSAEPARARKSPQRQGGLQGWRPAASAQRSEVRSTKVRPPQRGKAPGASRFSLREKAPNGVELPRAEAHLEERNLTDGTPASAPTPASTAATTSKPTRTNPATKPRPGLPAKAVSEHRSHPHTTMDSSESRTTKTAAATTCTALEISTARLPSTDKLTRPSNAATTPREALRATPNAARFLAPRRPAKHLEPIAELARGPATKPRPGPDIREPEPGRSTSDNTASPPQRPARPPKAMRRPGRAGRRSPATESRRSAPKPRPTAQSAVLASAPAPPAHTIRSPTPATAARGSTPRAPRGTAARPQCTGARSAGTTRERRRRSRAVPRRPGRRDWPRTGQPESQPSSPFRRLPAPRRRPPSSGAPSPRRASTGRGSA